MCTVVVVVVDDFSAAGHDSSRSGNVEVIVPRDVRKSRRFDKVYK